MRRPLPRAAKKLITDSIREKDCGRHEVGAAMRRRLRQAANGSVARTNVTSFRFPLLA